MNAITRILEKVLGKRTSAANRKLKDNSTRTFRKSGFKFTVTIKNNCFECIAEKPNRVDVMFSAARLGAVLELEQNIVPPYARIVVFNKTEGMPDNPLISIMMEELLVFAKLGRKKLPIKATARNAYHMKVYQKFLFKKTSKQNVMMLKR